MYWRHGRTVHRMGSCREQEAHAESYSGAPKEALVSWTFIKHLRFAFSSRERTALESRKPFL